MSDYIPSELIRNIIARLPVDDVLRCTSVCKSWYSLINSPSFTTLHLNLSSPNQEPRLLVSYVFGPISFDVRHYSGTFGEVGELDSPFQRQWMTIDCLNGLICLLDIHDHKIALWNPSLKKSLIVSKARFLGRGTIGFGFVPTSHECKIVRFSLNHCHYDECSAEIYELSTGFWRVIKLGINWQAYVNSLQAHLKGIIHWMARWKEYNLENQPTNFILTFDLINEKIGTLPVPSCFRHSQVFADPYTFKESLWLVDVSRSYEFCEIWIMKEYGETDSWEKLFNINLKPHDLREFLYFGYNGELLFSRISISDEELNDDEFCDKIELVSFNCNDNQVKNLGALGFDRCELYTYMESLIWCKRRKKAVEKGSSSANRTILPLMKKKVIVAEKNMDRCQKVERPRAETPINENEIRITSQGRMRSYIAYAMSLLEKKGSQEVVFKAMGRAINKTVTIVELIKRKVIGLHQITSIRSIDVTDTWEPLEEGLLPMETTRHVSMITITLSLKELDSSTLGYQPPLPADQVNSVMDFDYEGEGSRSGRGRGRGDRGRGKPNAPNEDGNWDGPARGLNRGGGRGYRGACNQVDAPRQDYNNNQDEPPVHTRGRGRGRGSRGGRRGRGFRANGQVHQAVAAETSSGSSRFREQNGLGSVQQPLCSNGCGFYGSAATMNYCSKCFKDVQIKKLQANSTQVAEKLVPQRTPEVAAVTDVESSSNKVVSNRCHSCRKRVGVLGFHCKCGSTFCGTHRYPEQHNCQFDFKSVGRENLAKASVVVKADKISHRI